MKLSIAFQHPANHYTYKIWCPWLWALLFGFFYWIYKGVWRHVFIWSLLLLIGIGLLVEMRLNFFFDDITRITQTISIPRPPERIVFETQLTQILIDKELTKRAELQQVLASQKYKPGSVAYNEIVVKGLGIENQIHTINGYLERVQEANQTLGESLVGISAIKSFESQKEIITELNEYENFLSSIEGIPDMNTLVDLIDGYITRVNNVQINIAKTVQLELDTENQRKEEIYSEIYKTVGWFFIGVQFLYAILASRILRFHYQRNGWLLM